MTLLFFQVAYMLVISEPEAEPLDAESPHTLGIRHDGMRISTSDGLIHLGHQGSGKSGASLDGSRGRRNDPESFSFTVRNPSVSPVNSNGMVNHAVDHR